MYVAHNTAATIQTGVIPGGEINRPRESFFPCRCGTFCIKWLAAID